MNSGMAPCAPPFPVVPARAPGAAHRLPTFGSRLQAAAASGLALVLGVAGAAGAGVAWLMWPHPGTFSECVDVAPNVSGRC